MALALWFGIVGLGQAEELSINQFLASATSDETVIQVQEKTALVRSAAGNPPYLREVLVGTETERFEAQRQKYSVRLGPTGWGETAAGRNMQSNIAKYYDSQSALLLQKALQERYALVIDWLYGQAVHKLKSDLKELYLDQISIFRQKQGSGDFDYKDFIDAENDFANANIGLIALESEITRLEKKIQAFRPGAGPPAFSRDDLIKVNQIETDLAGWSDGFPSSNLYLENRRLETVLAEDKYQLRLTESRRYINFFQVVYDHEEQNDMNKAVSCEVSLRLPWVSADRIALNRDRLDYLNEKSRYLGLTISQRDEWEACLCKLQGLFKQDRVLADMSQSKDLDACIKIYGRLEGGDPLIWLRARERLLKTAILQEEVRRQILSCYLELLVLSGRLSAPPLKNYLSAKGELLGPQP